MTEPADSANNISSTQPLYANANEALDALGGIDLFYIGIREDKPVFDSRQIAAAIIEDVVSLNPDWHKLLTISSQAHRHCKHDDAEAVQRALNDFLERHWEVLAEPAREYAVNNFTKIASGYRSEFEKTLNDWPALVNDKELHRRMAMKFTEGNSFTPELEHLALVLGTAETARTVLEHAWQLDVLVKKPLLSSAMAAMLRDSAGGSRWGQLQALLWLKRGDEEAFSAFEDKLDQHVRDVAALLDEFGLLRVESPRYRLSNLSPQSRESWRRELSDLVRKDIELRNAVVEVLFLYGAPYDDREVLFAAAALESEGFASFVEKLRRHSDRLVCRRAAALLDLMASVPDVIEQELLKSAGHEAERLRGRISRRPTRTWLGDERIEQLIEQTVNDVARKYSNEISPTRSSGEETHVAILFDRISQALEQVSSRLEDLARQHDEYEYLRIQLKHRIVGKAEEGGLGTDGVTRLSTDVCILFTGRDREVLFAQRASLLQAKRITRDVNQSSDRYTIDRSQLEDLSRQTSSGFLATLGPSYADVAIPIIPARLFLEMIERGDPSTVLYPSRAAELGKSIGTWLLEDVIGLWSGDWNRNVIDVAHGGVYRRPYVLVELVVERLRIDN